MKEKDFISVIKNVLNSKFIGDDCANLQDLGIVVTHDSLVEDVHFKLDYTSPFQLGYKSVMVNLSDIAASGAQPKYLTISLSLPSNIDSNFVEEFYKGAKSACAGDVEIIGGDITGSDKVFVSVCAIGNSKGRKISSRKNAKPGYKIIVFGVHGSSAAGLNMLLNKKKKPKKFIKAHLEPHAQIEFGCSIGSQITQNYAMMDTSDGLMDALSQIAFESGVLLEIDFDKIPYDKDLVGFENWQEMLLFGGEDYGIIAVVPKDFSCCGVEIGKVKKGSGVDLIQNGEIRHYTKDDIDTHIFNHFN